MELNTWVTVSLSRIILRHNHAAEQFLKKLQFLQLKNAKVHYRIHNSPPIVHVLPVLQEVMYETKILNTVLTRTRRWDSKEPVSIFNV